MHKIKTLLIKYREIISYLFFGVVTTLVNWAVYALAVRLFKVDLSAVDTADGVLFSLLHGASGRNLTLLFAASVIAWFASVLTAFVTNKLWVFRSVSWQVKTVLKEFGAFTGSRVLTGALEWFGIPGLAMLGMRQSLFGIEGFWAKLTVSIAVVILNYVFSKLIVFQHKKN